MDVLIQQIFEGLSQQAGLGGWAAVVGCIGVVVMFSIRFFRIKWTERFNRLPTAAKIALPFFAAAVGTFVVGVASAMAGGIAIGGIVGKLVVAAFAAGIAAIGAHETTSKVGMTMDEMMVKKDPDYKPGTLRKAMSIAVDMPKIDRD